MPETLLSQKPDRSSITPPKTNLGGRASYQRCEEIYRKLQESVKQCQDNYGNRKELATEKDKIVAELCDALENVFTYGLKQQNSVSVTASAIFQNMQEIVTGHINTSNDITFFDFCEQYLTTHERERYLNLKNVWTKCGRGRAFIRATLNENSLQRYVLTFLSSLENLQRYYSPWSLLLDADISKELPKIVENLNTVLFALTIDATELNVPKRATTTTVVREEPVIYAPTPVPVTIPKRKSNTVERPIVTANSTEDLLKEVGVAIVQSEPIENIMPEVEDVETTPPDNLASYLEFLKQPLEECYSENQNALDVTNNTNDTSVMLPDQEFEDKSDTSSEYSKSSSANCATNQAVLEERLREMSERCSLLETSVAKLTRENRQLVRRLTQIFKESGIDPSSSLTNNFLITIPHVQLFKSKHSTSYYAYEIHVTMRRPYEHWSIWRRYRDFDKLHKSLLCTHPSVSAVDFPPKKHFGNKNLVFVEERRQQLQIYLLNLVEMLPKVEACKTKAELQKMFPFFRER